MVKMIPLELTITTAIVGCPVGELLSGSVDKNIVVWKRDLANQVIYWLSW